jgi:hypothetical protein
VLRLVVFRPALGAQPASSTDGNVKPQPSHPLGARGCHHETKPADCAAGRDSARGFVFAPGSALEGRERRWRGDYVIGSLRCRSEHPSNVRSHVMTMDQSVIVVGACNPPGPCFSCLCPNSLNAAMEESSRVFVSESEMKFSVALELLTFRIACRELGFLLFSWVVVALS